MQYYVKIQIVFHILLCSKKKIVFPSVVISTFLCMRRMVNVVCSIDLKMREISGFEMNLQFTKEKLKDYFK